MLSNFALSHVKILLGGTKQLFTLIQHSLNVNWSFIFIQPSNCINYSLIFFSFQAQKEINFSLNEKEVEAGVGGVEEIIFQFLRGEGKLKKEKN